VFAPIRARITVTFVVTGEQFPLMSTPSRPGQPNRPLPSAALPAYLHPFARPAATREQFLTIMRGNGAMVMDSHGKWYVDGLASLWYCNVGHNRKEIINAVGRQMRDLATFHSMDIYTNPIADALAYRLVELAPMRNARVFYTGSGSEAVESAIKLARAAHAQAGAPQRTVIISRTPSYHGVNYGGMTATGLANNHRGFGPLAPDIINVPAHDLDTLDAVLADVGDRLAAIIAEPVIGAGGVHPPRDGYLHALRERCDRHGGFLILDEVITGFGRLGTWWGAQRYNVTPDLVTFAKGVTSGYVPLGGVLVGPQVREPLEADPAFVLRTGHTYSGHPTAAAAALANIDVIESCDLPGAARRLGVQLETMLRDLCGDSAISAKINDLRGDVAVWGVELVEGIDAVLVRDLMLQHGVIVRPIGKTIAICPPLVIEDTQIDRIGDSLRRALASI
jgi:putrescine aminotransferase